MGRGEGTAPLTAGAPGATRSSRRGPTAGPGASAQPGSRFAGDRRSAGAEPGAEPAPGGAGSRREAELPRADASQVPAARSRRQLFEEPQRSRTLPRPREEPGQVKARLEARRVELAGAHEQADRAGAIRAGAKVPASAEKRL